MLQESVRAFPLWKAAFDARVLALREIDFVLDKWLLIEKVKQCDDAALKLAALGKMEQAAEGDFSSREAKGQSSAAHLTRCSALGSTLPHRASRASPPTRRRSSPRRAFPNTPFRSSRSLRRGPSGGEPPTARSPSR